MKSLIIILLSVTFLSCQQDQNEQVAMFTFFKKTDKIQEFWEWFNKNKSQFELVNEEDEEARDEKMELILSQLHQIEEELSIDISASKEGLREITISAEGDINKFPIVKEIVAKAPLIEGWKVVAFRQPNKEDFTLEYRDLRLTPSNLYFLPLVDSDSLDIIIYGKEFNKHDYNTLGHYGLVMLDNVIGEYNTVTKIRHFDFKDISEVEDTSSLIPLLEINSFLEEFYQNNN